MAILTAIYQAKGSLFSQLYTRQKGRYSRSYITGKRYASTIAIELNKNINKKMNVLGQKSKIGNIMLFAYIFSLWLGASANFRVVHRVLLSTILLA